ncbi:MAG: 4Fe-4S binding protein [Firmicutes bacterium]|nr:4Fe-4S binding protein [Bacillota bacterium]
MAKGIVVIRKDRCKGCELCVSSCPKGVLAIDHKEVNVQMIA